MASRRAAVKLGIPALIVAGLAVIALWRVGPPPAGNNAIGTTGTEATRVVTAPLAEVAELLANNSVGREAWLEHVQIRQRVGDRYLWIGSGDTRPVFVVLDEDVKRDRDHPIDLSPGQRVTLIGIVRPVPKADEAVAQWHVSPATATLVEQSGTYLHVTEIRQ
jgi:hypothetical protein